MNRYGFEFSFAWLFALFVGIAIISLAVYASTQLVSTSSVEYNTKVAAQLGIILSPLETGLESSKVYPLSMPQETRIMNTCYQEGTFGKQELRVSVRSTLGEAWQKTGLPYSFSNKYVFSAETIQGKDFYLIVQPFLLPYKVGDLITFVDEPYCFVSPPEEIKDQLVSFGILWFNVTDNRARCPAGATTVCFGGGSCNISVISDANGVSGRVVKQQKTLVYSGNLLYAALFSDPQLYECQLTRLRERTSALAQLYADKGQIVSVQGCSSNFASDLQMYRTHLNDSRILFNSIVQESEELERENEKLICPLF